MTWEELYALCEKIDRELRAVHPEWSDREALDVQALCLAEEAGEFVGAYRRMTDRARRPGSSKDMEQELADVVVVAMCFSHRAGFDLRRAVAEKLVKVQHRGYRDPRSDAGDRIVADLRAAEQLVEQAHYWPVASAEVETGPVRAHSLEGERPESDH